MNGIIGRGPFALIGAVSLLTFANNIINLQGFIVDWINVWKNLNYFLWSWIPDLDDATKEYITMGLIAVGMHLRTKISCFSDPVGKRVLENMGESSFKFNVIHDFFLQVLLWPLIILINTTQYFIVSILQYTDSQEFIDRHDFTLKMLRIYWETFIYALILVAFSALFA